MYRRYLVLVGLSFGDRMVGDHQLWVQYIELILRDLCHIVEVLLECKSQPLWKQDLHLYSFISHPLKSHTLHPTLKSLCPQDYS